eukprot:g50123.t1
MAGKLSTTAEENTFIGAVAGTLNTLGNRNTAVGAYALSNTTTGSHNTTIGMDTASNSSGTASYCVYVGYQAVRPGHFLETRCRFRILEHTQSSSVSAPLHSAGAAPRHTGCNNSSPASVGLRHPLAVSGGVPYPRQLPSNSILKSWQYFCRRHCARMSMGARRWNELGKGISWAVSPRRVSLGEALGPPVRDSFRIERAVEGAQLRERANSFRALEKAGAECACTAQESTTMKCSSMLNGKFGLFELFPLSKSKPLNVVHS